MHVADVRARERCRLAHELHDIVTHHLANVALRTMGRLDELGADELRAAVGEVNDAAGAALGELRLLARLLGDPPEGAAGTVAGLSRPVSPRAAAAAWSDRLDRAGLVTEYTVPEAADRLARSVQSTVVRTFEATAQALLRHAAAGSRCRVTVEVEPTRVVVRAATSPPPVGLAAGEPGPDLLALRERVDLVRGTFGVGVSTSTAGTSRWVVTVVLPLD